MASAFYRADRDLWIADFRGYGIPPGGKRRTIRVPTARLRGTTHEECQRDASAFADECERYCRLLEGKHDPEDIQHARRLGIISVTQADALASHRYVPLTATLPQRLTIKDAALSHPSTMREKLAQSAEHTRYLDQFVAFSSVEHLSALTYNHVTAWVGEMIRRGWTFDTRRHALLYIRRACALAPRSGLPDVLAELPIDRRGLAGHLIVQTWPLDRLVATILRIEDDNVRRALILGGLCGLRPSEECAADDADLDRYGVLRTGTKTPASARNLPLPAIVVELLAMPRRGAGALLRPHGPRAGSHYTLSGLHQLTAVALKGPPRLKPKDLRKSFASWAQRVIDAHDLERWLGHASALFMPVTNRHYLAAYAAEQLRPASLRLDAAIRSAMPSSRPSTSGSSYGKARKSLRSKAR